MKGTWRVFSNEGQFAACGTFRVAVANAYLAAERNGGMASVRRWRPGKKRAKPK